MRRMRILPDFTTLRVIGLSLLLACLVLLAGCVKFASSAGLTSSASLTSSVISSEILASPFRSSSRSSDGAEEQEQEQQEQEREQQREIEEEIKIYTAGYISAGADDENRFQQGLGDIAARHGISDWEASTSVREGWVQYRRGTEGAE